MLFNFDGPMQSSQPNVFVMETSGGGEGAPPAPVSPGEGTCVVSLTRSLVRSLTRGLTETN